jgi:DNA-binding transcriptional MerR regulator/methylmalonyl-CoA mutase cobalamin-binding subunit
VAESTQSEDVTESEAAEERLWPMGAVTRRTGIGQHTLRAWERRFGFPEPRRLPSGHRRYTGDQVAHLLLIAEALRCGHRAGDIVPLSRDELEAVLRETGRADELIRDPSADWLNRAIEAGRRFDRSELTRLLQQSTVNLGFRDFLDERIVPLLIEVGEAWERGEMDVRHEHFISEVAEDLLRGLRVPLEAGASGRPVLLACLPGEPHTLGLQFAAASIVAAGRSVRLIGRQSPVLEIARAAESMDAIAVGLSVTEYSANPSVSEQVAALRAELPDAIQLWIGGGGAPYLDGLPAGVRVITSPEELDRQLRELED